MSQIVVSYRRADSQAIAGRIVDRLIAQFGEQSVFMDVDNIPFGTDFREHIQSVLAQAQVLIAVIGPQWLGAAADGHNRMQEEDDPVRVEIETAMRRNITLIPVLVNGAGMPKVDALPDSLKAFAFLNAAPVDSGRDFRPHVDRLAQSIGEILGRKSGGTDAPKGLEAPAPARARSRRLIAGEVLVLLLAGGALAWQLAMHASPSPSSGTAASLPAGTNAEDEARWSQLKDSNDIGALRQFAEQYPNSKHRADAEQRVNTLAMQTAMGNAIKSRDGSDNDDWTIAKTADTYDAYQAYLTTHPQGAHAAEANQAGAEVRPIANALKQEPAIGMLRMGQSVIVDDHDPMCKRGEVKVVTGGDVTKVPIVYRTKKCVSRDQFP
jgi:hypothetical protein